MTKLTDSELLDEIQKRFKAKSDSLDTLEKLTEKLKKLNKKLEDSEQIKTHFLSNIRNEIINPFSSILGLSQNILQLNSDNIDKIHSKAKMIYSEAFTLDFQLQNIFAAAEIEAGNSYPNITSVNIDNVCKTIIASFKHELEKKQLHIEYEISPTDLSFKTDMNKLKIIISNLISNSIKFSNPENKIELNVSGSNNELKVVVKDDGKGIDKENIPQIFDRFKRINDDINTLNSGHGLGLSIVHSFVETLGGNIELETELNKGSKFIVLITESENIDSSLGIDSDNVLFDSDSEVF